MMDLKVHNDEKIVFLKRLLDPFSFMFLP